MESRVDRLSAAADRNDADAQLRAIRAELYRLRRYGPGDDAVLGPVNRRIDDVIAQYRLYPLPLES